jgi:hypothetical protein
MMRACDNITTDTICLNKVINTRSLPSQSVALHSDPSKQLERINHFIAFVHKLIPKLRSLGSALRQAISNKSDECVPVHAEFATSQPELCVQNFHMIQVPILQA